MTNDNATTARRAEGTVPALVGGLMTFEETLATLEYIGTPDQPKPEHGGFHPQTILCAQSALHYLRQLSANKSLSGPEPAAGSGYAGRTGSQEED